MARCVLFACLLLGGASLATAADRPAPAREGGLLYIQRCATCHDPPLGKAPGRDEMANWGLGDIAASMREGGAMRPMADGLSEAEIEGLARFIQSGGWRG